MLWIIATLVAYFIKGLCGFANTLVFDSILGFGATNVNISPVELVLGYPTNMILMWRNRKKLSAKIILPLCAILITGSVAGAILLKNTDTTKIKIVFGAAVVLLGIELAVREFFGGAKLRKESKVVLFVIGLVSGLLSGLFGVGVLLASYVNRVTKSNDEFKANISAVFLVENTVRIISYSVLGIINLQSLKTAATLMPFMLISLFAGMKSANLLNEKTVKKIVIVLLIISGVALIIKSIR